MGFKHFGKGKDVGIAYRITCDRNRNVLVFQQGCRHIHSVIQQILLRRHPHFFFKKLEKIGSVNV